MRDLIQRFAFVFLLSLLLGLAACSPGPSSGAASDEVSSEASSAEGAEPSTASAVEWALAIHGGAGVLRASVSAEDEPRYQESLRRALDEGRTILESGGTSLDAVEAVIRVMEDDPLFNAGRGSVFTSAGENEMDAAIMDGSNLACGAVTGLRTVRHPITLARRVMDSSRHVFFAGDGAEAFADQMDVERVEPEYFFVQRRYDQWQRAVEREQQEAAEGADEASAGENVPAANGDGGEGYRGTVGAVALDRHGNLAAATSTGGMTNKRFGRIGDVPVIGAGTYASNASAAVSCTGHGERFIEHTVARNVAARMEYGGESLEQAARAMIHQELEPGDGGLIAVGADGSLAIEFNTEGMFHGAADSTGREQVGIWPGVRKGEEQP
ncbi:MAG: isoaspartyl peptidase/L-asparaginase [Acidobacteriota bacterium]|nr:isoaspartyl peptidase/L-asparaginase [Acidobacteriota bacterium]